VQILPSRRGRGICGVDVYIRVLLENPDARRTTHRLALKRIIYSTHT
jgi:hypothetical protein